MISTAIPAAVFDGARHGLNQRGVIHPVDLIHGLHAPPIHKTKYLNNQ
jgi:hypothetical protein